MNLKKSSKSHFFLIFFARHSYIPLFCVSPAPVSLVFALGTVEVITQSKYKSSGFTSVCPVYFIMLLNIVTSSLLRSGIKKTAVEFCSLVEMNRSIVLPPISFIVEYLFVVAFSFLQERYLIA